MNSDKIDISYVAELARIALTEQERELFQKQLGDVLTYMDKLGEVDVSGFSDAPLDAHRPSNMLRDDDPRPCLSQQQVLANAPDRSTNEIVTPKIIE